MFFYTLDDFALIDKNEYNLELPDETKLIIDHLSSLVGSPEYIKTPQFKNRVNNGRRKKKGLEFDDNDWQVIRSFKPTEILNSNKLSLHLDNLRGNLNKLTPKTYDNLINIIKDDIRKYNEGRDYHDIFKFSDEIFRIISTNLLYSKICATLYKELCLEFEIYNDVLRTNLNKLNDIFLDVEYVSPDENYNKFCENNKNNEIRRAVCSFYINLMKIGIIDRDEIYNIILNLYILFEKSIKIQNKNNENDELCEILYILVSNGFSCFNSEQCKILLDNVKKIISMNISDMPSLSNKCIFKHMDIIDKIE